MAGKNANALALNIKYPRQDLTVRARNGSCKKRFVQETVRARNGSFERAMQKNMIDPTQFLQEIIEYAVAVRAEHIDESGAID